MKRKDFYPNYIFHVQKKLSFLKYYEQLCGTNVQFLDKGADPWAGQMFVADWKKGQNYLNFFSSRF